MSRSEPLSQWIETVSTAFPTLSRPQAKVLAFWSYGMELAKACGITLVCAALALQLGCSEASLVQRLQEWCLRCSGQKRKEASRTGCESVFCTIIAVDPFLVACRSAAFGTGLGCNDVIRFFVYEIINFISSSYSAFTFLYNSFLYHKIFATPVHYF